MDAAIVGAGLMNNESIVSDNASQPQLKQPLAQLKFTTSDGSGRQPSEGVDALAATEIDNDFNILASFLAEEAQKKGLGLPPANSAFNPMAAFQGMNAGGLLGLNFSTRMNSSVGWPILAAQFPQQLQHLPHQPPQQLSPTTASQAHQGQPMIIPSPFSLPQPQPLLTPAPVPFFGAGGIGIAPQPQHLPFVLPPQRYFSPMAMGSGGIIIPMSDLRTPEVVAEGTPSIGRKNMGSTIPGAPGISVMEAKAGWAKADFVQETKKRRREEESDVERKFKEKIVRRRERNRLLARKTRMRKQYLYQSLQKRLVGLRSENKKLRAALMERMGERAKQVVYDCTSKLSRQIMDGTIETDYDFGGACDGGGRGNGKGSSGDTPARALAKHDFNLMRSLQLTQQNLLVTEPSLPDNPIIFASEGFLSLTGYANDQVIGRNLRFLQGPDTDRRSVATIRRAIERGEDTCVNFLNYKADGTPFWNQFFVAALRDARNRIMNYVGALCPVPGPLPPFKRNSVGSNYAKGEGGGRDGAGGVVGGPVKRGDDGGGDCVRAGMTRSV